MKLSTEQIERLAERVFKVIKASGHVGFDYTVEEKADDLVIDTIVQVMMDDARQEERLSKEAERLVQQQNHIAKASGMSSEDLVNEVKARLAKSKKIALGDGPERADSLAEKVFKAIWKLEPLDFYSPDQRVQNCIAKAIYRFRMEDDRFVDSIEKIVNRKVKEEEAYSPNWCALYDRYLHDIRAKMAAGQSAASSTEMIAESSLTPNTAEA